MNMLKDTQIFNISVKPWQNAFVEAAMRPLELKEAVIIDGPYCRRAIPGEKMQGVIEGIQDSVLWPGEKKYTVLTHRGTLDTFYDEPAEDLYHILRNRFGTLNEQCQQYEYTHGVTPKPEDLYK